MRSQYDIMQSIKQLIEKKKYYNNDHLSTNNIFYSGSTNLNDISNSSDLGMFGQAQILLSGVYNDDGCTKSKFTQEYE
jgi:hypothetical protein